MRRRAATALLLLSAAFSATSSAQALAGSFRYERTITPGGTGPNRLPVDVPLLVRARPLRYTAPQRGVTEPSFSGGLEDLRLYDGSGKEVGYLLIGPPMPAERWQDGNSLPVQATETESGFEVDLGSPLRVDRLRLIGIPAPFLKRVRLEGGGDRSRWSVLVADATVFDLPDERLQHTELSFNPGEFQYFRVTWNDQNSAPVPLPRRVSARVVTLLSTAPAVSIPIDFERRPSEPGNSRFRLHLPGAQLPITALELSCGGAHLLRQAQVGEPRLSGTQVVTLPLGSATLRRAVRGDLTAADLRVPISRPQGIDLDLVVDDGNNPPLELLGVSAELAPLPAIYFESATGEPLTARFGNPTLAAPAYDLEAMRESFTSLQVIAASWGENRDLGPAPTEPVPEGSPLPATGAPIDTTTFRYARKIPAGPPGLTALALDAAVLAHSRDLSDLRIADTAGSQVPYLFERLSEPLSLDLEELQPLAASRTSGKTGESRYRLVLPYDGLPAARLVLSTTARVFSRQIMLTVERPSIDSRSQPRTETVASAAWVHVVPDAPAPPLVLNLPRLGTDGAQLVINEGDNSALPLLRPKLLLPAYRLRFFRPSQEELTFLYGRPDLDAPRYDLALLASRMPGEAAHETSAGPEVPAATLPTRHGSDTQTKLFWGALVSAVVVLIALIARLMAKSEDRVGSA